MVSTKFSKFRVVEELVLLYEVMGGNIGVKVFLRPWSYGAEAGTKPMDI